MFSLDGLQNALPVPTLSERVGDLGMRDAYHELRTHGITPGVVENLDGLSDNGTLNH